MSSRSENPDSLSSVVVGVLDDFEVPVPTGAMRVIAAARRGRPVTAENLSRLAAGAKEEFLRHRSVPRLCVAVDRHARAPSPRIWARGTWRLQRRLATPDALEKWQLALAHALCGEMTSRFSGTEDEQAPLARLALSSVAHAIGPVAAYLPGTADQWQQLRDRLPHDWNPTGATEQQEEAEKALLESSPTPVILYFGLEEGVVGRGDQLQPTRLHLPLPGDRPQPFHRIVANRLNHATAEARQLIAYLQGWSHLRDDLGRPPTTAEFADRWSFALTSVKGDEALFARAFPEEESPERIVRLLDEGLPVSGRLAWMMEVELVDGAESAPGHELAVGQRWVRPKDKTELTVSEVTTDRVIAIVHQHGTSAIEVLNPDAFSDFELLLPDLWLVKFDVDCVPAALNGPLTDAGLVPTRFARPSDLSSTRPPRAGTVEAQVTAADAQEARRQTINALRGHQLLKPDEIFVRRLASHEAFS